jgi:hypothetical protein
MKVTKADVNRATSHFWYISSPEEYFSKADFFKKKKKNDSSPFMNTILSAESGVSLT